MQVETTSKKAIAAQIYKALSAKNKTRKEIISSLVEEANLTQHGASTYYANFKSGVWSTDPSANQRGPSNARPKPSTDFILYTESGSTINVTRELHGEPEPEPTPRHVEPGRRADSSLDKRFALQGVWS